MPTALAEWTTERPDEPGYYWWMRPGAAPEVVDLRVYGRAWNWMTFMGSLHEGTADPGSLWWPVRLDVPPVG